MGSFKTESQPRSNHRSNSFAVSVRSICTQCTPNHKQIFDPPVPNEQSLVLPPRYGIRRSIFQWQISTQKSTETNPRRRTWIAAAGFALKASKRRWETNKGSATSAPSWPSADWQTNARSSQAALLWGRRFAAVPGLWSDALHNRPSDLEEATEPPAPRAEPRKHQSPA